MSVDETRVTKVGPISKAMVIASDGDCCLVQIYGPELGRKFDFEGGEQVVGRDIEADIVVDLDNVSRKHCCFSIREGRGYVHDLGSTNGTYLNDKEIHEETALRSGDLVKVGGAIFKFLDGGSGGDKLDQLYYEEIYRLKIVDGLTQIPNKRFFLEYLEREMARCHRYGRPLSMLMFDLDHFKRINDENGHLAGDAVLREVAALVKTRVRKEECFARYGGEEFAVVRPESGPANMRTFADKLLKMVAEHTFVFEGKIIPVTMSIGLADMSADLVETAQFIKVADANLYRAKREGRNRVIG